MQGHFELIQKRISGFDISKACKFYDYAPNVFSRIRRKFGLSDETYLRSIGPENLLGSMIMGDLASLTELMSSGKSGSFFYFTGDCKCKIEFFIFSPQFFVLLLGRKLSFILFPHFSHRFILSFLFNSTLYDENDFQRRIYFF